MSTMGSPRPLHPFPHLIMPAAQDTGSGPVAFNPAHKPMAQAPTRTQRRLLDLLAKGARILFDIEAKRALILSQGFRSAGEVTVRALADLVRRGLVVMTGREGRLVLYRLA